MIEFPATFEADCGAANNSKRDASGKHFEVVCNMASGNAAIFSQRCEAVGNLSAGAYCPRQTESCII